MTDPPTAIDLQDGTVIHYDATGDGPRVLIANVLYGHPGLFAGFTADLSRDHQVISYDLRGTGGSSRNGPWEPQVDHADLEALLEHLGGVQVIVGVGDGCLRAVRIAAARPDLAAAVAATGTAVLARAARQSDPQGLSGSRSVLSALVTLLSSDYRAGLRSIVEHANPGITDEEVRTRVERMAAFCPQEVAIARLNAWRGTDAVDEARAIGDRLWVLHYPGNPWFPEDLLDRLPELLPDAQAAALGDGPFARPEDTAAIVRRISGAA
jgi:pimeloyl-ACP methyl ester carboxylesterase